MKTYYPPRGLRKYYFRKIYIILFIIILLLLIFFVVTYQKEIKYFAKSKGILKEKSVNCLERWYCNDWNECNLGTQNRTCRDIKSCGTSLYEPQKQRSCIN